MSARLTAVTLALVRLAMATANAAPTRVALNGHTSRPTTAYLWTEIAKYGLTDAQFSAGINQRRLG